MKYLLFAVALFIFSTEGMSQKAKKLFNGKDLTGWKIHGTEKWYVENGELVCESGPDKGYAVQEFCT
jgi:hypothetical protein